MTTTEQEIRRIDGVKLKPREVASIGRPTYDNFDDERRARKVGLAAALRVFGRLGYGEGVAGHITARGQPVNRAAFVLHAAIHKARPDVIGAAHAHSTYGKAWSSLGRKLDPITQDACIFYGDHTVISEQGGKVVFEVAAGEEFASLFPTGKAAIHQNHGLFTVGTTVEAAAFWFITMDRSCQAQLLAEAAGTPKLIDHDSATYTQQLTGFADAGWFQFQPLFQEICATDPDLFD